jgi:hypothetical protein
MHPIRLTWIWWTEKDFQNCYIEHSGQEGDQRTMPLGRSFADLAGPVEDSNAGGVVLENGDLVGAELNHKAQG